MAPWNGVRIPSVFSDPAILHTGSKSPLWKIPVLHSLSEKLMRFCLFCTSPLTAYVPLQTVEITQLLSLSIPPSPFVWAPPQGLKALRWLDSVFRPLRRHAFPCKSFMSPTWPLASEGSNVTPWLWVWRYQCSSSLDISPCSPVTSTAALWNGQGWFLVSTKWGQSAVETLQKTWPWVFAYSLFI